MSVRVGDTVRLEGLQQSGMNGLDGTVVKWDKDSQRWVVDVDDIGRRCAFREVNLVKVNRRVDYRRASEVSVYTDMSDEGTIELDGEDINRSRRVVTLLVLLCIAGLVYYRNTSQAWYTSKAYLSPEMQGDKLTEHLKSVIDKHVQLVDVKRLARKTPEPITHEESLRNVFARIADRYRRRVFKDKDFLCVRMSPGRLLSDAVAARNVTWISFGQDAPQSEFMVRCFQKIVKLVEEQSEAVDKRVYIVRDADDKETLNTKDETMFLEDAMRWVTSRMTSTSSLCSDMHTLLESLSTPDGILLQSTPGGCNFIERLLCSSATHVMQFGGPRDDVATGHRGLYHPICGDLGAKKLKPTPPPDPEKPSQMPAP